MEPKAQTRDERRDAFANRLLEANIIAYEVATVHIGDRLGFYRAIHEKGEVTAAALAMATGTVERYVREWLEQQAVTGILEVAAPSPDGASRTYRLPPGYEEVLLARDSLAYLAPLARFTVGGVMQGVPRVLNAFRTGEGVSYESYGEDARVGQADVNRTMFVNLLGSAWLPAIADVDARLKRDPPARVADVGCGTGWSSISIARAYPNARVDGLDLDAPSIELARAHAKGAGMDGRVRFEVRDAADLQLQGRYDLVTVFEALHDMARPVEALRAFRNLLAEGGSVIIADERTEETFTAPGQLPERLFYGWSVLFCLPTGMEQQPSAETGAVMRPDVMRRYAKEAGFREVEVLPIEHDLWRFYRLRA